jgi:carbamoyl-phosphate synthase large subunit
VKPPKILVTGVCGDVGYSIVRALSAENYEIVGVDVKPYCPVLQYIRAFYQISPAGNPEKYLHDILKAAEKHDISIIMPSSEAEIKALDKCREIFAANRVMLAINSPEILATFFNKKTTADYFTELGFRVPQTWAAGAYDGSLGFPVLIKAKYGCGSKSVRVVNNIAELEDSAPAPIDDYIVQQIVGTEDQEYTTTVFSDCRRTEVISFRRYLGFGGASIEVHPAEEPAAEKMARRLAEEIGLFGSLNIQTRKVGAEHLPFEINPRISSTVMFRSLLGFQDAHWWIQSLLGRPFNYKPVKKTGLVGLKYIAEIFIDTEAKGRRDD